MPTSRADRGQRLQVQAARWQFPGQPRALFEIDDLVLEAGASLGIGGPSGAGKTTLFHCLSGIAAPNAGSIRWNDTELCVLRPEERDLWRRRHLGLVFQDFHLVEGLTAIDNVLLPAYFDRWRCPAGLRQRAAWLLDRVGIGCPRREAALLSRGERQRVALARALLLEPGIVLADEPTGNLDARNSSIAFDLLARLAREHNIAVVMVTHNPELAARCDRVLQMLDGRFVV